MIGPIVTVTVDRPLGSFHSEHPDIHYPINYGYIKGTMAAYDCRLRKIKIPRHQQLPRCRSGSMRRRAIFGSLRRAATKN